MFTKDHRYCVVGQSGYFVKYFDRVHATYQSPVTFKQIRFLRKNVSSRCTVSIVASNEWKYTQEKLFKLCDEEYYIFHEILIERNFISDMCELAFVVFRFR